MKRIILFFILLIPALVLAFFVFSYIVEFRPDDESLVNEYRGRDYCNGAILPDTLRIMTWNIGYAGLGDNMDFCVDGGQKVRDSKERTEQNLSEIIGCLKDANADIYLLQEVDKKSHRTYSINEIEAISNAFPDYYVYFAPNFKVWFVPSPLKEPIGRVCSGLLILSRIQPLDVRRISYPSSFSFPVRMFNIKRCLLEAAFITSEGRTIHIGNTHNTAFDTGGMRIVEDNFLKERITSYSLVGDSFIVAGDWNQCPPQYIPAKEELENKYFVPELFDTTGINSFAAILCDTTHRSMRFNDKPYSAVSTKSILDFFVVSREVASLAGDVDAPIVETIDYNFHSSDHNPVIFDTTL